MCAYVNVHYTYMGTQRGQTVESPGTKGEREQLDIGAGNWTLVLKMHTHSQTLSHLSNLSPHQSLFGFPFVFHTKIILSSITISSDAILCCPLDLIVFRWMLSSIVFQFFLSCLYLKVSVLHIAFCLVKCVFLCSTCSLVCMHVQHSA